MIFYFSGCGNSKHVAETIAAGLNDNLVFIPEAAREGRYEYELAEGERLGFVFPIYSWAPPKLVLDFVKKMQLKAKPDYLYFVCTCGDNCGLTEKVFRKAIEEKGWHLSACFSAGFKLDTEKNAQLKIDRADDTMMRNIPRLIDNECFSEIVKGSLPWLKTYLVNPGFNKYATDDSKYRVDLKKCTSCGRCMYVCPVQNIKMPQGEPVWLGHCIMCMACYHQCRSNAIQYGKATVGKGQYYFGKKLRWK